ncbi:hypothetical protein TNCV_2627941 [Trichonephila clavipes]|nr:hypothetical protein TNCV_2627941 [Trichonephila clavipes]
MDTSPVAPLRKRGQPRKVTSTSTQNTHVPSLSTASTAISSRTIISQQKLLLLQQLILQILSPRRDVVESIGGDCNPSLFRLFPY